MKGWATTICECGGCQLSFSTRRDVPEGLYDCIYRQASQIPGYDRYIGYATQIRKERNPGEYLAAREAPYKLALDWLSGQSTVEKVLEIGCGLGYLTHALRRQGLDAVGVDLSGDVVRTARERFDDPDGYMLPDEVATRYPEGFDAVIGLEIVEHVPDPVGFVREAMGYLKAGGALVLSTPNRDAFTSENLWDSDTPPVHLTWFGSLSMQALAIAVSADLEFIAVPPTEPLPVGAGNETFQPFLDETGVVTRAARIWASKPRRKIDGVLVKLTRGLHEGRQRLPGLPRPWLVPPSSRTLAVALTPRPRGSCPPSPNDEAPHR